MQVSRPEHFFPFLGVLSQLQPRGIPYGLQDRHVQLGTDTAGRILYGTSECLDRSALSITPCRQGKKKIMVGARQLGNCLNKLTLQSSVVSLAADSSEAATTAVMQQVVTVVGGVLVASVGVLLRLPRLPPSFILFSPTAYTLLSSATPPSKAPSRASPSLIFYLRWDPPLSFFLFSSNLILYCYWYYYRYQQNKAPAIASRT